MYEAYFDFNKRPFPAVPQADRYFPGSAIETARQTLTRCLERGEGAGMVVGSSGTGKTLLCRVLAEQIKDSFPVALLSSGRLSTRRALLQAVLYELGQPYRGMDEGELRLALVDYLTGHEDCPAGMVLLVDEAHTLPLRLLDEIRMLTNLTRGDQLGVRLILAGDSALEERFASPKLDSFSQRLVARCYLEPFNRSETQDYIHVQVDSSGGSSETVFPADTCQAVYQATNGVPRLINQVCDHALLLAYVGGRQHLEPADIEEAWADLQQLPAPCSGEAEPDDAGGHVIEFGSLDDRPGAAEQPTSDSPVTEDPELPPLRISPETGVAEPHEQIERIEEMLAGVDEEFQPAGTIGPEVELVFDEPGRPFKEPFQEEEIVANRYMPAVEPDEDGSQPDDSVEHLRLSEPAEIVEAGDPDLIVVEEEYDDGRAEKCSVVPVQKHEYARLFAKLRHG